MDTNHSDHSEDKGLSSADYRARLLTKLNCLIAVLEVAIAKISRSMGLPGANAERLTKIRSNLENTLSICNRAKGTLESGAGTGTAALAAPLPSKSPKPQESGDNMTYRDYVELSSIDEYQKFKSLPPIKPEEIETTDIDRLIDDLFTS